MSDIGDYYNKVHKGVKVDPFLIAKLYGLSAATYNAMKKILRAGEGYGQKDRKRDLEEAIVSLQWELDYMEVQDAN